MASHDIIYQELLKTTQCTIRLYLLEGINFSSRDYGSPSDPYCKIKCGNVDYNERDNYQQDEPNPKFNKMY